MTSPDLLEALRSGAVRVVPSTMTDAMADAMRLARMNVIGGYDGPGPWEAALAASPDHTPDLVALMEGRDEANRWGEILKAEQDAIAAALPGVRFMDPPDGGAPTLAEQVTRMRAALDAAEAKRDALREALAPFANYLVRALEDPEIADDDVFIDNKAGRRITYGDLRRARALTQETPNVGE